MNRSLALYALATTAVLTIDLHAIVPAPDARELILDAPLDARGVGINPPPHAARSRVVQLNPVLLSPGNAGLAQVGTRWTAGLFPDLTVSATVEQVVVRGDDRFVSVGRIDGLAASQVIVSCVDGVVAGSISLPGVGNFQLAFAGDGLHWVHEVDESAPRACSLDYFAPNSMPVVHASPKSALRRMGPAAIEPLDLHGPEGLEPVIIDFVVHYTQRALDAAGGDSGILALLDYMIAEANYIYDNSAVDVRWNIVHHSLIGYADSGNLGSDWEWLGTQSEALRTPYGADLVLMIVELEEQGWAGIAGYQHSVFKRSSVTAGGYVVPHEVGHLLGAGHDHFTCEDFGGSNCGARHEYSYGHRLDVDGMLYSTVMAYQPGIRIPFFSNPDVNLMGVPTGVPRDALSGAADNAFTMNQEAPLVAALMNPGGRFEFAVEQVTVSETAGEVRLEVVRTDNSRAASVNVTVARGTAQPNLDYQSLGRSGITVNFASGESSKEIGIGIMDDDLAEGSETFYAVLTLPSAGQVLGLKSSVLVTLEDNETGIHFAASSRSAVESDSQVEVVVSRYGLSTDPVTLRVSVRGGSADAGVDFAGGEETISFAANETERSFVISLLDDLEVESDETIELGISDVQGSSLLIPGEMTLTLIDDDRPGSLDRAFGQGLNPKGTVGTLAVRPDGRILCGGRFTHVGETPRTALVQYLPDGTLDTSFASVDFQSADSPEVPLNPSAVGVIVLLADGRAYAAGSFGWVNGQRYNHLVRLNPDGSVDETFAPNPGPRGNVADLVCLPDGRIMIAGRFHSVSGWGTALVARLHADGRVDETFRAVPLAESLGANSLVIQPDGSVIVGGFFTGFEGLTRANLIRLTPDGTPDGTFLLGRGGQPRAPNGAVWDLLERPDGSILVAGSFTEPRNKLFGIDADGTAYEPIDADPPLNGPVWSMAMQLDGKILIAGEFVSTPTEHRNRIARLHPNGVLDTSFDTALGADATVLSVALQPAGTVLIGGSFGAVNGLPAGYLARLNSDGSRPVFRYSGFQPDGAAELTLLGNAGASYAVQTSQDMVEWNPLTTLTLPAEGQMPIDPGAQSESSAFYRAVSMP